MRQKPVTRQAILGLLIALLIIAIWGLNLVYLLTRHLATWPSALIPLGVLFQTFLYTGMFITAHDSMHRALYPPNRAINDALGAAVVFLYALFGYRKLRARHYDHHRTPASPDDPDYHDGKHRSLLAWYFHFMLHYLDWKQLLGMAILFNVLLHLVKIPIANLLLFWVAPALLSTLQLFIFGTYLPHRDGEPAFRDQHRARSNAYPVWLSFLSCYHFGYHWEHHAHPNVPWWRLPAARVA